MARGNRRVADLLFVAAIGCASTDGDGQEGGSEEAGSAAESNGPVSTTGASGTSNETGSGSSTDGSDDAGSSDDDESSGTPGTSGGGGPSFEERCNAPGVLRCVGFDDAADIAGTWGDRTGIMSGDATPELDPDVKASGASALRFTIPSNSGSDSSGSYFANFSDDLATQFGENATFFVQWRQRFSPEMLTTQYDGGGGFKLSIIGTGDQDGCSADNAVSIDNGGSCSSSCTSLEVVTNTYYQEGFPGMYNSCSGSASHGPYDPFQEPFSDYDFKLQNGRPEPYCLYSQGSTDTFFPPTGNCHGYVADEWMTFQVEISTGARVDDEWVDSHVRLWIANEGQPSELAIDWGPYNLTAGDASVDQRFGKVWLTPYHTGKDPAQSHPVAYTWYDELIVSTERIVDPEP